MKNNSNICLIAIAACFVLCSLWVLPGHGQEVEIEPNTIKSTSNKTLKPLEVDPKILQKGYEEPVLIRNNAEDVNNLKQTLIENVLIENPEAINHPDSNANTIPIKKKKESKLPFYKVHQEPNSQKDLSAVPLNDEICNATLINPSGDPTDCVTQVGGNADATDDYYGGCVQPNHNTIWFKFEITAGNDYLLLEISTEIGKEMECMLFTATCSPTESDMTLVATHCALSPFAFEFWDLTPGWYYLSFSTQPGSNIITTDIDFCFTESPAPEFVTGPEQDCNGAIPVCDMTYVQDVSYQDYWLTDEIPTGATCLYGGEHNSVWYVFTPQTSGDFEFELVTLNDYDWALYDLDAIGGCDAVPASTPIACNYSATSGSTGMSSALGSNLTEGASGSPWSLQYSVTAGTTYALIVDNYTGDSQGYTLDFTSSTASIADNPPATGAYPTMSTASVTCTDNTITITMSEHIKCISIVEADFNLTNTTTSTDFSSAISSITGTNCSSGELSTEIVITHDGTLTTGVYQITINASPTLQDKCGNLIPVGDNVSFDFIGPLTLTASDASICTGDIISLDANGADGAPSLVTYILSPGGATNTSDGVFGNLSPAVTTLYTVSATFGGCTKSASASIAVEGNINTIISPPTSTVCSFPADLTASTTINGTACVGCTYVWSTTETTNPISVGSSGTYSVTVTTPTGCNNSNNPSSTLSLASAGSGGGTCDVIYVSPAGGGDGYTKDAPTTLSDAITKAMCTYTTIKMAVGVYTLTDFQAIHSYATLEGGYNSTYTLKSSDMSGGANSTTIRRTSSADSDVPADKKCSAFVVDGGAEYFRIQDLRIELPGSPNVAAHVASSQLKNYGIRLGSGCTEYNIVRCYIDAGAGANP